MDKWTKLKEIKFHDELIELLQKNIKKSSDFMFKKEARKLLFKLGITPNSRSSLIDRFFSKIYNPNP